jgi:hypothetical protein
LKEPYRVHNVYKYPSWLKHYQGSHPQQIEYLQQDLKNGILKIEERATKDIENLLASRYYRCARFFLILLFPIWKVISKLRLFFSRLRRKIIFEITNRFAAHK